MEKKINLKKHLIWLLLLLIILAVSVIYYLILKPRMNNEKIADYLKHPDKIPSQVLDNDNFNFINFIKRYLPFQTISSSIDIPEEKPLAVGSENQDTTVQQKLPIINLTDNAELVKNIEIDKKNIFIDSYKLSLYRNFLSEIQSIIINFFQDKPYQDEIDKVKMFISNCPNLNIISPIIDMLAEYNQKYLISPPQFKESIIDKNKVINKFIKIEKESPLALEKETLRQTICQNLNRLRNIIFSSKTEQIFLNSNL